MGKKSRDREDGEAVKFLFGTDNPYSRKPQPEVDAGANTLPTKKARLEISGVEHSDARKRWRDREITAATLSPPSSDDEPFLKKRKKPVVDAEVDGLKKKNTKMKREDVESEYEKRKFDCVGEKKPAATVLAIGEKRKAGDAAAADMVDTEGPFDDESKLLRTVFVRNLALKTRGKALNREFARFGEIESVRIRSVPLVDAKARGKADVTERQINKEDDSMNACIVFKEEQSALAVLSNNMTKIGGNHIRVDMACPPRKKMKGVARLYDRKRTVFVGNLPFDVKDEELYLLFRGLGQS